MKKTQTAHSPDVTNTTIQSSQLPNQKPNRNHIDHRNNQLQQLNSNYYNHQNIENYNQNLLINNNNYHIPKKYKKENLRTLDRITQAVHIGYLASSIASIISGLYWIDTNFFVQNFADSVNQKIVIVFIPFYVISLIIRFIPLTHYFFKESAKEDSKSENCGCGCGCARKNSANSSRQVSDGTTLNVNQFFPPQENSISPLSSNNNSQYMVSKNNRGGGDTIYHTDIMGTQKALIEKRLNLVSPQEQLNNDKNTKDIFNFYTEHQNRQMELNKNLQIEDKMGSNELHERNYDSPNLEFFIPDSNIYNNAQMANSPAYITTSGLLHKRVINNMQDQLQLEFIREQIGQHEQQQQQQQQQEGEHRVNVSTSNKSVNDDDSNDMPFQNFDGNYFNDNSDCLDQQTTSSNEVHDNVNHTQKHEDKKTIEYLDYEYNDFDEEKTIEYLDYEINNDFDKEKIKSNSGMINAKHQPKVSNASSGLKVPESIIETDEEYLSGDLAVQPEVNKVSISTLKPLVVLSRETRLQNFTTNSSSLTIRIPNTPLLNSPTRSAHSSPTRSAHSSPTRSAHSSPTRPIIADVTRESKIENLYHFGSQVGEQERNLTHENDEEIEFPLMDKYYVSRISGEHDDKSDNDDADVVSLTQIKSSINSTSKRYSANDTLQNIVQLANNQEQKEDTNINEINHNNLHANIDIDVNDIEDVLTGDLAEIPTHSSLQWPTSGNKSGINHISLESWNKNSDLWMKDNNRMDGGFSIFNKRPHIDHYTVTDGFSPKHNVKHSTSNSDSVVSALVSDTNTKESVSGLDYATSISTSSGAIDNKLKSYTIPPLNYNNTTGGELDSDSANDQLVYTDNEDENDFYTSLRNESFISSYEILSKSKLDKLTTSPNLSNIQANSNTRNSKYAHHRQSQSEDAAYIGNNNNSSSPISLRHYKSFIHKRSNSSSPIKKLKNLKTDLSNGVKHRRSLDDVRGINLDFIEQLQYSPSMIHNSNNNNNSYHHSRDNSNNNNHVRNRSKSSISSPTLRSPSRRSSFHNNSVGSTNRRRSVISLKKSGSIGKLFNIGLGINGNNGDSGNTLGGNTCVIISGNDSINSLDKDISYAVSSDIDVHKLSKASESLWTHSDSSKESFYPDSVIGEYDREKWKAITKTLNTETH
ncbi:hypothetical protein B5S30_g4965 [[Candida] boidinii]|nr:hypothetical protein B5S30_g4965 [[Candida] boidinii]